jgi:hypothetical protein
VVNDDLFIPWSGAKEAKPMPVGAISRQSPALPAAIAKVNTTRLETADAEGPTALLIGTERAIEHTY